VTLTANRRIFRPNLPRVFYDTSHRSEASYRLWFLDALSSRSYLSATKVPFVLSSAIFTLSTPRRDESPIDAATWRSEEGNERCEKLIFDRSFWSIDLSNRGCFIRTIHTLTLKLNALPFYNGLRITGEARESSHCSILMFRKRFVRIFKSVIQPEGGCKIISSFIAFPEYSLENLAYFVTHSHSRWHNGTMFSARADSKVRYIRD